MLRLDKLKAKELGINKMLVTCDEGNDASEKTILAVLQPIIMPRTMML
jgi:predicted acetyltransferase